MQVVSAQWLKDSVAVNKLLPCTNYKTDPWYAAGIQGTAPLPPEGHPPIHLSSAAGKENCSPATLYPHAGVPKSLSDEQGLGCPTATKQLQATAPSACAAQRAAPPSSQYQPCTSIRASSPPLLHQQPDQQVQQQQGQQHKVQQNHDNSSQEGQPHATYPSPRLHIATHNFSFEATTARVSQQGAAGGKASSLVQWLGESPLAPPPDERPSAPRINPPCPSPKHHQKQQQQELQTPAHTSQHPRRNSQQQQKQQHQPHTPAPASLPTPHQQPSTCAPQKQDTTPTQSAHIPPSTTSQHTQRSTPGWH